ncbi:MAG TPA: HAD family phosphatase [Desulfomonilaceae bacterium]|nr:HAD family phosphatase [Desulfomonilaceae bacterium]
MIQHILFDLGNVLVPVHRHLGFTRLIPHLPKDLAELCRQDQAAFQNLFSEPGMALETGSIEFHEFYRIMCDILRITVDEEQFRDVFCRIFSLDEEMVELGERFSRRYGTWLVSNTSRVHYEYILSSFPRVNFYRDAALSFELGVMKPAPEYYEKAVRKFGIQADTAVFIDDLPENVDGAVASGMNGIVFRNRQRLIDRLAILGVTIPGLKEQLQ